MPGCYISVVLRSEVLCLLLNVANLADMQYYKKRKELMLLTYAETLQVTTRHHVIPASWHPIAPTTPLVPYPIPPAPKTAPGAQPPPENR